MISCWGLNALSETLYLHYKPVECININAKRAETEI